MNDVPQSRLVAFVLTLHDSTRPYGSRDLETSAPAHCFVSLISSHMSAWRFLAFEIDQSCGSRLQGGFEWNCIFMLGSAGHIAITATC